MQWIRLRKPITWRWRYLQLRNLKLRWVAQRTKSSRWIKKKKVYGNKRFKTKDAKIKNKMNHHPADRWIIEITWLEPRSLIGCNTFECHQAGHRRFIHRMPPLIHHRLIRAKMRQHRNNRHLRDTRRPIRGAWFKPLFHPLLECRLKCHSTLMDVTIVIWGLRQTS